jgi:hypothetical protein
MLEIVEFALVGNNAPKRCVPYLMWCQLNVRHWLAEAWGPHEDLFKVEGMICPPRSQAVSTSLRSGAVGCDPPNASRLSACRALGRGGAWVVQAAQATGCARRPIMMSSARRRELVMEYLGVSFVLSDSVLLVHEVGGERVWRGWWWGRKNRY